MSQIKVLISIDDRKTEDCPICMERIVDGQLCLTNTCMHMFCKECLSCWSRDHNFCPFCRNLFSIIIFINHFRHKNDFKLIAIENKETKDRKALALRREILRQSLANERVRRLERIDQMRQQIILEESIAQLIQTNIDKLEDNESQTNGLFRELLDEVRADTHFFLMSSNEQNVDPTDDLEYVALDDPGEGSEDWDDSETSSTFLMRSAPTSSSSESSNDTTRTVDSHI